MASAVERAGMPGSQACRKCHADCPENAGEGAKVFKAILCDQAVKLTSWWVVHHLQARIRQLSLCGRYDDTAVPSRGGGSYLPFPILLPKCCNFSLDSLDAEANGYDRP